MEGTGNLNGTCSASGRSFGDTAAWTGVNGADSSFKASGGVGSVFAATGRRAREGTVRVLVFGVFGFAAGERTADVFFLTARGDETEVSGFADLLAPFFVDGRFIVNGCPVWSTLAAGERS